MMARIKATQKANGTWSAEQQCKQCPYLATADGAPKERSAKKLVTEKILAHEEATGHKN